MSDAFFGSLTRVPLMEVDSYDDDDLDYQALNMFASEADPAPAPRPAEAGAPPSAVEQQPREQQPREQQPRQSPMERKLVEQEDLNLNFKERRLKFNSTNSVNARSMLAAPDVDDLILGISLVLELQMHEHIGNLMLVMPPYNYFDEAEIFARQKGLQGESAAEKQKRRRLQVPSLESIYRFLRAMLECSQCSVESTLIALVLVNRLLLFNPSVRLHPGNWRPIWITASLIAQKTWDDKCLKNIHFSKICCMFTTKDITDLEMKYLEWVSYEVLISPTVYAKYYFEIRDLMAMEILDSKSNAAAPGRLTMQKAKELEENSMMHQKAVKQEEQAKAERQHKSTNAAASSPGKTRYFFLP